MEYRILGPIEVFGGRAPVDIGPPQQRALLALLLVSVNRVVSTDRILEQIWPEDPSGKERTLWVYISRLRAALEPGRQAHSKSSVLVTKDHGYMLRAETSELDWRRFESLAAKGGELIVDDPEAASRVLNEALDLWRGTPLEDFAYHEFAQPTIARLTELRLVAIEDRTDAELRAGRHREVLGELEQLIHDHPFRERFVSLQMIALYRSGRQGDALRAFERYRHKIGEELGLEPSPELRTIEEHVLLHDDRLAPRRGSPSLDDSFLPANPFKGLRSFGEDDASTFFGRERLVADIVRRVSTGATLITLVGASGSGKSSVLHAGLVPAIRKAAIEGSDDWLVAKMVPGARPFREVEAALARSTLDAHDGLGSLLDDPEDGLLRACLRLLHEPTQRILLVIDQFEELFTLGEDPRETDRFIRNLEVVINDPHRRVVVVTGLRADFYGRPLEYPHFAQLLGANVVNVVPLMPDELEAAAEQPAGAAGVQLEPALVVQLLGDVAGQVGTLPLFQYALTELFDRRQELLLTLDSYRKMGEISGAVARRAEELFLALDTDQRVAAKQLFLRLVTISEQGSLSRRRVAASEVVAINADVVALHAVLDKFARHRLLTFDREPVGGSPTVEVAHEALLDRWPRLLEWIEDGRRDVRRHALLVTAMLEWNASGQKPDYLLSGERLADYESWALVSTLRLDSDEESFLDQSITKREADILAEEIRMAREKKIDRRARRRLLGLIPGLLAMAAVIAAGVLVVLSDAEPTIAVVHGASDDQGIADLMIAGAGASERDRDIVVDLVAPLVDPEARLRELGESRVDLVVVGSEFDTILGGVAVDFPDTHWVAIDPVALHTLAPNISEVHFAVEDSAFLAGAAAALSTSTRRVGFIGGFQSFRTESSRNGFEQGAAWEDEDVDVESVFLGPVAHPLAEIGTRSDLAFELAMQMYAEGIDVIFHDAEEAGAGVVRAARELSGPDRQVWTIGSDVDEFLTLSATDRQHVLTSAIKRFDTAVQSSIAAFLDGSLNAGESELDLAAGGVGLSRSGDHLAAIDGLLANLEGDVAFGHIPVSAFASGEPNWQLIPDVTVDLTLRDDRCEIDRIDGATPEGKELRIPRNTSVLVRLRNESNEIGGIAIRGLAAGVTMADLEREAEIGIPTSYEEVHAITLAELGATTSAAAVVTGTRLVANCILYETDIQPSDFSALIVRPTS